jgi:hypothetical protein
MDLIRTNRVGEESINFINYSSDRVTLARLNKLEP